MKTWRAVVLAVSLLLLSGCLVSFKTPLPDAEAAPKGLLGQWTSTNAWGEPLNLELTKVGKHRYQAISYFRARPQEREAIPLTVSRHGSRWYLSAKVPARYGGHFVIAGFELTDKHELVVYNLDLEQVNQAIDQKILSGQVNQSEAGDGVLVDSDMDKVFSYLDDPANSDVFSEAVRYQRQARSQ
ncbi:MULTISPECIES: hypothetical protein [Pseudomonas]|uniref:Lipoprotein n=2 Tax=Pseudomonas TaxID=286 RepID=A0A0G3GE37_9PSED|nr:MULTISPECIES: hypothetical protein [Pseudomonas]AKJ98794.1 lipoprotein [Pseudomonas chlororaphis]KIQ58130.1 lipoprotein [Pseudomonas fluorescens]BBP66839.1 hypothetical protein PHLH5_43800 [Pseudomonas sp. Cab53]